MLIQPISHQQKFSTNQIRKNNNSVSFKSNYEREEELRRLAELRLLEEQRAQERKRALEAAIKRAEVALEALDAEDAKARRKIAADTEVIERIIARNRAYEHSVNRIKIELILNAGLEGNTELIDTFKSELEKSIREKKSKINARNQAKASAEKELAEALEKKKLNQKAALSGNEAASADVFWANSTIRRAEQTLRRCDREESRDSQDMAGFETISKAIAEAEKLAAIKEPNESVVPVTIAEVGKENDTMAKTTSETDEHPATSQSVDAKTVKGFKMKTKAEATEKQNEKALADDAIKKEINARRMAVLDRLKDEINKYPAIDNEMSTKMAVFFIGFICSIQNSTAHDIGEYFGDEKTAKALREKLSLECQRRSIEDRKQLQGFDELKDPVMMLIAASRMKKFAPKEGILTPQQQQNLFQGIKDAITMSVKNGDMSNFDDEDKILIDEMIRMINVSKTTDFGISFKLEFLINKLNKKKLNLGFIPTAQVRELESKVKKAIKH